MITTQKYWNDIGATKVFEDPFYLNKFSAYLSPASKILDYGCGYGRLLRMLKSAGYDDLIGFDFASNMIARGHRENPNLDLRLLQNSGTIPCHDEFYDAVVISTVLCCMTDEHALVALMKEVSRVLKMNGILYLTDFLISEHERFQQKYTLGLQQFGKWGIYTTNENLTVRHFTTKEILDLLGEFDIQWYEQFDFKTMNQNPVRSFHCIAKKRHGSNLGNSHVTAATAHLACFAPHP